MSRFSPTVAPESYVGDIGGQIAQALHDRQMLNYSRDMTAYQTGFGATPVDPNQAPSGIGHSIKSALYGMVGKQNPDDQAYSDSMKPRTNQAVADNAQANNQAIGQRFATQGPGFNPESAPSGGVNTPGAFNPSTGGFMPATPQRQMVRLPSGAVVDQANTMYGMNRAMFGARMGMMGADYGKTVAETNAANAGAYKSTREANAPHLGDANYAGAMGDVAGQEAVAKLPADIRMAVINHTMDLDTALKTVAARGQIESGLQQNQQGFTAGQNTQNRAAVAQNQQTAQGASLANRLAETRYMQSGQIIPNLVRGARSIWGGGQINVPGVTAPQANNSASGSNKVVIGGKTYILPD